MWLCRRIFTRLYVFIWILCIYKEWFFFILATEIQNIQIGEGDVARNIEIPIRMLFPRTFTCPTLLTTNFKIGMFIHIYEISKEKFEHFRI